MLAIAAAAGVVVVATPDPARATSSFTFLGGGWGHGVGMSQYGALGMARAGSTSGQILGHYYTGTTVQSVTQPGEIRVRIGEPSSTTVTGTGALMFLASGAWMMNSAPGETVNIAASGSSIVVTRADGSGFTVQPGGYLAVEYLEQPMRVSATGLRYVRGVLQVVVADPGALRLIIRRLSMREYLYGLGEMPSSWPEAALHAQAIAGRTYAKDAIDRRRASDPSRTHDLEASVADQAYIGYEKEAGNLGHRWISAVEATGSSTVTHNGAAIQAFYSSSSGGHTENSEYVFSAALPYLRGVADPFDAVPENPNRRWSRTYTGSELASWVAAFTGSSIGEVIGLHWSGPYGVSGRVNRASVRLIGAGGEVSMSGNSFRTMVNRFAGAGRQLQSTLLMLDPVGSVDGVTPVPAGFFVYGWALDPSTAASIAVHVYVDGRFSRVIMADGPRPDVGAVFPGYGDAHGYRAGIAAGAGRHVVCIYAINDGPGSNPLIGCRPVDVGGSPIGNVDVVKPRPGGVTVHGWAVDRDTAAPITIHTYVNGSFAGAMPADGSRPDVARALPGYGPLHGFEASLSLGHGVHEICVYGINVAAGGNVLVGCRWNSVSGAAIGNVDDLARSSLYQVRARGWALDLDTFASIDVHAYIDGTWAGAHVADIVRSDVGASYPGYGDTHGFDVEFGGFPAGGHTVCLYAVSVGGGPSTQMTCRRPNDSLPFGNADFIGRVVGGARVVGWAIDPDVVQPIGVHVYVDSRLAAIAVADGSRPDVGAVFPGYGSNHGFDHTVPLAPGVHQICLVGINDSHLGDPALACSTVT